MLLYHYGGIGSNQFLKANPQVFSVKIALVTAHTRKCSMFFFDLEILLRLPSACARMISWRTEPLARNCLVQSRIYAPTGNRDLVIEGFLWRSLFIPLILHYAQGSLWELYRLR